MLFRSYNAANQLTNPAEFMLWEQGQGIQEWSLWDLSGLGNVLRVEFNLVGSDELYASGYGLGAPGYFAYDNVAVRFPKENIGGEGGGVTTDITTTPSPITNCQKILHHGQLLIIRDGKVYNANGMMLK